MQTHTFIELVTPSFDKPLFIEAFYGHEQLSYGINYTITIVTCIRYDELTTLIGTTVQFKLQTLHYERYFSGIAIRLQERQSMPPYYRFQLTLASSIELLKHHTDFRIFKNTTIQVIIHQLLEQHGFANHRFESDAYRQSIVYRTQYNESSYDFIRRLLGEYDLIFYVTQTEKQHTIVFSDKRTVANQLMKTLTLSELAIADYQLWRFINNSCYSSYPNLTLPLKINDDKIILSIKHQALNQSHLGHAQANHSAISYFQYLTLCDATTLPILKITAPTIAGIQTAVVSSKQINVQPLWDYRHTYTHPLNVSTTATNHTPTYNFKPEIGNETLIQCHQQHVDRPYINGYRYTQSNRSPFLYGPTAPNEGWYAASGHHIKLTPDNLTVTSPQNLSLWASQSIQLTAVNTLNMQSNTDITLKASNKLIIKSNESITLGTATNGITISAKEITINGLRVQFNKNI
ncbi:MAG: hypothetical protein COB66_06725 [Coxiella sp. (in: Bacteria)]|nr:MAG: hypothetical protein COB66_06725 [Coxiella sp. (in: g-proteobacteria)]